MRFEYVTVWQKEYAGGRDVHKESDDVPLGDLIRGCQRTVENHGGVIHLYEIKNDGTLSRINTFGIFRLGG